MPDAQTTKIPNLFSFATKELAQDAALAYILSWARPEYRKTHGRLHELGVEMLRALLATWMDDSDLPIVNSLEVGTQVDRIDLVARINDETESGIVLIVEDKIGTDEHSNQIERYVEGARQGYPNRKIVPVYVKTGNVSRGYLPSSERCGRLLRNDLLQVLDRFHDTGDTIIDNFRRHLQDLEDATNGYRDLRAADWDDRQIEGFYVELENRMSNEPEWKTGWSRVNNARGGFCCFTFGDQQLKRETYEVTIYCQIEDAKRLTVRLGEWTGPGIDGPRMHEILELLQGKARDTGSIEVKKAGRFRGGASAAVAELTFDNEDNYLKLTDTGVVDVDATMQRLDHVRRYIAALANLPG